jgi:DNA gyrase subunit B
MEELEFRAQTLLERLREMAFLNKSLEIVFRDERVDPVNEQVFKYEGGIIDFVTHLNSSKEPLFARVIDISDTYDSGEVDIALQWNTGFYEGLHSFANNIATTEGGMHEAVAPLLPVEPLRAQLRFPQGGDENPRRRHPRGLTAICVKLRNPQFEGQTKTKLGNTEIRSFVERDQREALTGSRAPERGQAIVTKSTQAARGCGGQACDYPPQVALESALMPGKLADCSRATPKRPVSSSRATCCAGARPRFRPSSRPR